MCAAIVRFRWEDPKWSLSTKADDKRGATGAANPRVAQQCAAAVGPEAVSKTGILKREVESVAVGHSGVQSAFLPIFFLVAALAQTYVT